jgi:hypothetical protein
MDYYEGDINDKYQKHGFGKFHYGSMNYYEGYFYEDVFCGHGFNVICINNIKEIYKGIFNNNMRYGYGELTINNDIYTGFFENDEKQNVFIIKNQNNTKYELHDNGIITILNESEFENSSKKKCNICTEFVKPENTLFCGCNLCTMIYCNNCVKKIYSDLQPGTYITETKKMCKFCSRHVVSSEIIKLYDTKIKNLTFQKDDIYGCCKICNTLEKTKMSCNHNTDNTDITDNFECTNCLVKKGLCKKCPSCQADIIKNGGCNHMTCICSYQWCWECDKKWGICNHVAIQQ